MAKFGKSLRLLAPGCPKALLWDVRLARFSEGSGLGGTATPWQSFSSFSLAWFSEEKDWLQAECMTLSPTYCSCSLGDLRFAVSWNILIDYCEPWQLIVTSAVRKNPGVRGNFIHTPCIKVRLILTKSPSDSFVQPTCQWLLSHVCSSPKPTKPGLVLTPGQWYDGIWWNVSVNWIKGCAIILQISLSGWWTTPNGINYKHLMRKMQNHNHLQFQCLGSHFQTLNIPRHAWGIGGIACFGSSWLLVTCSNIMQYHEIGWILLIGIPLVWIHRGATEISCISQTSASSLWLSSRKITQQGRREIS